MLENLRVNLSVLHSSIALQRQDDQLEVFYLNKIAGRKRFKIIEIAKINFHLKTLDNIVVILLPK